MHFSFRGAATPGFPPTSSSGARAGDACFEGLGVLQPGSLIREEAQEIFIRWCPSPRHHFIAQLPRRSEHYIEQLVQVSPAAGPWAGAGREGWVENAILILCPVWAVTCSGN
eukprot:4801255-Alexandrium_andersonii.AAC.1